MPEAERRTLPARAAGDAGPRQPPPAGFGKQRRLLGQPQFRSVLRHGYKSRDAGLMVCARANGRGDDRLGIAVSRKVDTRAVGRNRIKRQIREFFRQQPQPGDMGLDCVVVAQKPAAHLDNHALRAELVCHWQRLRRRFHADARA